VEGGQYREADGILMKSYVEQVLEYIAAWELQRKEYPTDTERAAYPSLEQEETPVRPPKPPSITPSEMWR
jgi:hypothetical protein